VADQCRHAGPGQWTIDELRPVELDQAVLVERVLAQEGLGLRISELIEGRAQRFGREAGPEFEDGTPGADRVGGHGADQPDVRRLGRVTRHGQLGCQVRRKALG
jgi:hypothetical protein